VLRMWLWLLFERGRPVACNCACSEVQAMLLWPAVGVFAGLDRILTAGSGTDGTMCMGRQDIASCARWQAACGKHSMRARDGGLAG